MSATDDFEELAKALFDWDENNGPVRLNCGWNNIGWRKQTYLDAARRHLAIEEIRNTPPKPSSYGDGKHRNPS